MVNAWVALGVSGWVSFLKCYFVHSVFDRILLDKRLHFSSFSGNNDRKPCNLTHETSSAAVPVVTSAEHSNLPPPTAVTTTAAAAAATTMYNGKKDTSNADVQKLQEQLNDIKEQVSQSLVSFKELKFLQGKEP